MASEKAVDPTVARSMTAVGIHRSSLVAQRHHGGAARLFQQPTGFADEFAARDLGVPLTVIGRSHAQPATDEEIYSVRYGSLCKQPPPGGQREVGAPAAQFFQGQAIHARQVGAVPHAVDGRTHLLPCARWFFLQCHPAITAEEGCFLIAQCGIKSRGAAHKMSDRAVGTVIFSHGKESGPWGGKITAMAAVVRDLGIAVDSVDYRGLDDPAARVDKLIVNGCQDRGFAGSGRLQHGWARLRGGCRDRQAARLVRPRARVLHAGLRSSYAARRRLSGHHRPRWADDIVPVDNSVRWAREHRAALHILDAGHRLEDQIEAICRLLRAFLSDLG